MAQRGPPIPYPYLKNQFGESIVAVESHYGINRGRFIVTITRGGYNDFTFAVTTADGIWRDPPRYEYIKSETKEDRLRTNAGIILASTLTQEAKNDHNARKKAKRAEETAVKQAEKEAEELAKRGPDLPITKISKIEAPISTGSSSSSSGYSSLFIRQPSPEVAMFEAQTTEKPLYNYTGQVDFITQSNIFVEGTRQKRLIYYRLDDQYGNATDIEMKFELVPKKDKETGQVYPGYKFYKGYQGGRIYSGKDPTNPEYMAAKTAERLNKKALALATTVDPLYEEPSGEPPATVEEEASVFQALSSGLLNMIGLSRGKKEVIPVRKSSSSLKMSSFPYPLVFGTKEADINEALAYGRAPKNTISSYFTRTSRPEGTAITTARAMSVELKDALNRGKRVFCLWTIGLDEAKIKAKVCVYGDMGTPSFFVNGEMTDIENFRIAIKRNRRNLAESIRTATDAAHIKLIEDFLKIETQKIPDYDAMKHTLESDIRRFSASGNTAGVLSAAKALRKLKKDSSVIQDVTKADKQVTLPYTDSQYEKYAYQNLLSQKELESYMVANDFNNVQARDCLNVMSNTYNRALYETAAALVRTDPTPEQRMNPEIMNIYNAVRGLVPARRFIKPISVEPVIIKGRLIAEEAAVYHVAPEAPIRRMDPNPQRGGYALAPNATEDAGYADAPPYPFTSARAKDGNVYNDKDNEVSAKRIEFQEKVNAGTEQYDA